MTHSTDLQWLIVRRNSKFFQLRNGVRLSSDPLNNNGNWTKRQSGFLQEKAAVVQVKKGKLVLRRSRAALRQPKSSFVKKGSPLRRVGGIEGVGAARPDLADVAFRRARKLAIAAPAPER